MRWTVFYLSTALAFAQGTTPKPAPTEYEVHSQVGTLDLGAEYMVHSFSAGDQMFLAENYLVVEVALYPVMKGDPVNIDLSQFRLRINHKTAIAPDHAARAAASLRQSPWQQQRPSRVSGGIGAGPIDIPIGGQQGPYPGGPQDRRLPNPPRAPDSDPPPGVTREKANPEDVLLRTALPEGPHKGAVSGFIYFPFNGKSSSLKTVDLEYDGVTLKLK
jgi:hypothetical protein